MNTTTYTVTQLNNHSKSILENKNLLEKKEQLLKDIILVSELT